MDNVARNFYVPNFAPFAKLNYNGDEVKQMRTEQMYIRVLTEMAANRFEWVNLPKSCKERYLEMTLFNKAFVLFFYDALTGWKVLNAIPNGMLNELGDHTGYTPVGVINSYNSVMAFNEGDDIPDQSELHKYGIPIWANYLRMSDLDIVLLYASRLAFIDASLDINVKSARRTRIMAVTENQLLTAANVQRQIDRGESVIPVSPGFNTLEVFKSLDLGVEPKSIQELHLYKTRLWNECMGMLGINNSNQDKKERLVADEVAANDNQIEALRRVALNERRAAARAMSELTGTEITVNYFKSDEEKLKEKRAQELHEKAMQEPINPVDSNKDAE